MLTFALLMSARMGIFQETLYKKYGKHAKEALFYNVSIRKMFRLSRRADAVCVKELCWCVWFFFQHCLPLPGFLLLSTDIYNHCVLFNQSSERA